MKRVLLLLLVSVLILLTACSYGVLEEPTVTVGRPSVGHAQIQK